MVFAILPTLLVVARLAQSAAPTIHPDSVATATAVRAARPPRMDGRDDDPIWKSAPEYDAFREFQPTEDGPPRFRTTFRVVYDDRYLYVFMRAYDPHPDSLMHALSRRDFRGSSEQLKVVIDSYHDRRTGYEFAVNPDGVKRDYAVSADINEDGTWDAVWDAATTVDSLGWTAAMRIPFSQLRFAGGPGEHVFGFGIWRDIERFKERTSWPVYRQSLNGFISQLGQLAGVRDIPPPHQVEVTPYVLAKNSTRQTATWNQLNSGTVGADVKYGVTSNFTLDATINPDFGQVQSDPSVLNLGDFETYFQEQRPFFIEGAGLYRFDMNCNIVNCSGEGLFYSRRIGRSPQLSEWYGDASSPRATPIAGAAKLTGRTPGGLAVGALEAVTDRDSGPLDQTLEPRTAYTMIRALQDFDKGKGSIGVVATAVNRSLDQWSDSLLRREAYVGGFDFRRLFHHGDYQLSGSLTGTHVGGSRQAIASTQRSPVHEYQRPDGSLHFDSTLTSLDGNAEELIFAKLGGGVTRFQTSYQRQSAGYEPNDLGFLLRADEQSWSTWTALTYQKPTRWYRSLQINFNEWNSWTTNGLKLQEGVNTNVHANLPNNWWVYAGGTAANLGATYCDRCSRGGPATRASPAYSPWAGITGDDRRTLVPSLWFNYSSWNEGKSRSISWNPSTTVKISSALLGNIGVNYTDNMDDAQWLGNFTDLLGDTHYSFAHLQQHTLSLTMRLSFAMTPNLTLEFYGAPFVTDGTYSNPRELSATPRAASYNARYQPYAPPAGTATGFDFRQLRANTVLRWEYRPGSTLFVVWTHGRDGSDSADLNERWTTEYRNLFALHPENTFIVKVAYWLSR
jgi:hypothetical protein